MKTKHIYIIGFFLLVLSFFFGIVCGADIFTFNEIKELFTSGLDSPTGRIAYYSRLPRALACLVCGGALAVSGAIIQRILSNRLASPSVIGISSGAGAAIAVCAAMGIYNAAAISFMSFVGALTAVLTVTAISKKLNASEGTVVLIGVALNSLLNAVTDSLISIFPNISIISHDFKLGSMVGVTYNELLRSAFIVAFTLAVVLILNVELDILSLGNDTAVGLGLRTSLTRALLLPLAALLASSAVSVAGILPFVGLIIPNAVRKFSGGRSLNLILMSFLYGASFVCICDTLSRTLFSPYEIPVGIIMSFLGVPFFITIIARKKYGE